MDNKAAYKNPSLTTRLLHEGSDPAHQYGFVNTPVYHGSTVLFPTVDALLRGDQPYTYGRRGTPTSDALTRLLITLEGAAGAVLCPSGLSAVTTAILACVGTGDHLLVTDSAYQPTRYFCDTALRRFGVETTYYDPRLGGEIATLIRPTTRAILTESPGSQTFEIQDVPAIVEVAQKHNLVTLMDNTWATPLYFRPLDHGLDLSIMSATKYIGGHSDLMMGTIAANAKMWPALKHLHGALGLCVGPDDVNLALRGLRTMTLRLERHQTSALSIAEWLKERPEVARVLHPGLSDSPDHALWRRDFKGSSGLFAFVTKSYPLEAIKAMLDGLTLFGMGYSWGGYESLALFTDPRPYRTATRWDEPGHLIRLSIGLEPTDDLKADLAAGFDRLSAALS